MKRKTSQVEMYVDYHDVVLIKVAYSDSSAYVLIAEGCDVKVYPCAVPEGYWRGKISHLGLERIPPDMACFQYFVMLDYQMRECIRQKLRSARLSWIESVLWDQWCADPPRA